MTLKGIPFLIKEDGVFVLVPIGYRNTDVILYSNMISQVLGGVIFANNLNQLEVEIKPTYGDKISIWRK